jgi:peptidoglycan hydrolase-like protein with peptidoglycan-binding domain
VAAAKARHHRKRSRRPRRPRARTLSAAVLLAVVIAGAGVVLSGALPAGDADLEAEGAGDVEPTTTTAPTTTEAPTTTTTIPTTTTTTAPPPAADGKLELGEAGGEVAALQQRLTDLGYWLGTADGTYGQLTRQAVMAFQKASGLGRDGVAGPATLAALQGAGRVTPSQPTGDHLEIDLARQLLIVVEGGQAKWVLNTSTGNGEAYADPGGGTAVASTPAGSFSVYREIDGLRRAPLGNLYRPKYFNGGIAIHGAGSIPAHPASHGCARVTNSAMDLLWSSGAAAIGTPVIVH